MGLLDRVAFRCCECSRAMGDPACKCRIHVECTKCKAFRNILRKDLESDVGFEIAEDTMELDGCPECQPT